MEILKKIIIRILALSLFLCIANFLYTNTQWKEDTLQHADLLDSIAVKQNNTDVLYLSSSSNYFRPPTDTTTTTISQYLNLNYPSLRINSIHKGYMHSGIFYSILENIPVASPIRTIIVSVNLRSFGAFWVYSDVESNYSAQQLLMQPNYPPLLKRFLLSLNYFDNKSKKERESQFLTSWSTDTLKSLRSDFPYKTVIDWDHAIAKSNKYKNYDGSINYKATAFACNIVKAFAFEINDNHPRVKDLDKIVELSKKRDWNLIFHILPEDIEKADKMIGPEIPFLLNQTKNFLIQRYSGENFDFINNLVLLDASHFYEKYPTEHYNASGKIKIAKKLAESLKKYHSSAFKVYDFHEELSTEFKQDNDSLKNISLNEQISKLIPVIKNDSVWYNNVIKKANQNNISIEKQLYQEAQWLIEKK